MRHLNGVRAALVEAPDAWPWSSCLAHVGRAPSPRWLDTAGLHGCLPEHVPRTAADHQRAAARYVELVAAGRDVRLWDEALRQQIYLGNEDFAERMQALAEPSRHASREVPRAQRRRVVTVTHFLADGVPREQATLRACIEGGQTMTAIARELGLSLSRVSRLIAGA